MRWLFGTSMLSLMICLASAAHADEAWFRLGLGTTVLGDDALPPGMGGNDSIQIIVDTTPKGRAYGDLSLPVVVGGIDGSYAVGVSGLPPGARLRTH